MKLVGLYHIALFPAADEAAFVSRMADGPQPQLTRVTSNVTACLLKRTDSRAHQYAWRLDVTSMAHTYDFEANAERLQEYVKDFGVVHRIETYAEAVPPQAELPAA